MTPFEIVTAILNLLALILIPIIAVIIGQHLQNVSAKRKDKMDVFKTYLAVIRVLRISYVGI